MCLPKPKVDPNVAELTRQQQADADEAAREVQLDISKQKQEDKDLAITDIAAKKLMREIMKDADISFNKTEIIKMMTKDGFADLEWTELQAFFRRIVLDN